MRIDWKVLAPRMQAHVGGYGLATNLAPSTCAWAEVADFTPYHDRLCALTALTTAFLGRTYTLKDSVDHSAWDAWPLSDTQRAYAAGDVCAVADVVAALSTAEWRHDGPSELERFDIDTDGAARAGGTEKKVG